MQPSGKRTKAKAEQEKLQAGNEEKQRRSAELDSEIADKEERARKADRENTDNIKSGIANLLGKGKYAAIEKENAKLKAENERIRKTFPDALKKEVKKKTKALTEEKQKAVGAWLCDYVEHQRPFDEIKHRHTLNEVGDVAEGRYDWKIERG